MSVRTNNKGFSLIEVVVASGVFALFTLGVYGGIQAVFQIVYQSRLRIIETSILNEQIEIIRNMSFFDVGIVNGSPAGLLERTVTTTRNGIDFEITRTIRSIDDPFDGTIDQPPAEPPDGKVFVCHDGNTLSIGQSAEQAHLNHGDTVGPCDGDPEAGNFDQSPADYKFVEVSVICQGCRQQQPLTMTTFVAPKYLEGSPDNGALFVHVIDANGQPVQGAQVHIISTSTNPTYDFMDETDNEGTIRLVDLAAGQGAYSISVSKFGYTTDGTTSTVPNPYKPLASVVAQDVTSRTFTIDEVSSLNITTLDSTCNPVGSVSIDMSGERLLGTEPDTRVIDTSIVMNGSGNYVYNNLPWDTYSLIPSGYDLVGAIPMLPLSVLPGANTNVSLILGNNSAYSVLVHVQDSATGDAISSSTVQVSDGGSYNTTKVTGIGTTRQTDWSGGANQELYTDDTRYWTDDGNIDAVTQPGNLQLSTIGPNYVSNGILESSIIDLGIGVNFANITWSPGSQPIETGSNSVRVQIATSNSSTAGIWNYYGPDGTDSTYYTTLEQNISDVHNGDQYVRYKLYLSTASSSVSPTVSDLAITYVTSCTPPGQAYFGDLANTEYTVDVSAAGYTPYQDTFEVSGDTRIIVELVAE